MPAVALILSVNQVPANFYAHIKRLNFVINQNVKLTVVMMFNAKGADAEPII